MYVTRSTLISDILRGRPDSATIFAGHGLGCPSCFAAGMETIEAVASMHEVDVDLLLTQINSLPEADPASSDRE